MEDCVVLENQPLVGPLCGCRLSRLGETPRDFGNLTMRQALFRFGVLVLGALLFVALLLGALLLVALLLVALLLVALLLVALHAEAAVVLSILVRCSSLFTSLLPRNTSFRKVIPLDADRRLCSRSRRNFRTSLRFGMSDDNALALKGFRFLAATQPTALLAGKDKPSKYMTGNSRCDIRRPPSSYPSPQENLSVCWL